VISSRPWHRGSSREWRRPCLRVGARNEDHQGSIGTAGNTVASSAEWIVEASSRRRCSSWPVMDRHHVVAVDELRGGSRRERRLVPPDEAAGVLGSEEISVAGTATKVVVEKS